MKTESRKDPKKYFSLSNGTSRLFIDPFHDEHCVVLAIIDPDLETASIQRDMACYSMSLEQQRELRDYLGECILQSEQSMHKPSPEEEAFREYLRKGR